MMTRNKANKVALALEQGNNKDYDFFTVFRIIRFNGFIG